MEKQEIIKQQQELIESLFKSIMAKNREIEDLTMIIDNISSYKEFEDEEFKRIPPNLSDAERSKFIDLLIKRTRQSFALKWRAFRAHFDSSM